jgi:hypothetical protein
MTTSVLSPQALWYDLHDHEGAVLRRLGAEWRAVGVGEYVTQLDGPAELVPGELTFHNYHLQVTLKLEVRQVTQDDATLESYLVRLVVEGWENFPLTYALFEGAEDLTDINGARKVDRFKRDITRWCVNALGLPKSAVGFVALSPATVTAARQ